MGILILNQPEGTVRIPPSQISANGKSFSVMKVPLEKDPSFERLNEILNDVAAWGGLHGEPQYIQMITRGGNTISADVHYTDSSGSRVAGISSSIGGGSSPPSWDVLLDRLTISAEPGSYAPIIVMDPSISINPYGQNSANDEIEPFNENPAPGLEEFVGREYDGSLKVPELDEFKGYIFGWSDGTVAVYGVEHKGRDLMVTGFAHKRFEIGESYELNDSKWTVQGIRHEGFREQKSFGEDKETPRFDESITLILKHEKFTPPEPLSIQIVRFVEAEKRFWQVIAARHGLELEEIEPQYTDKSPLTPWYRATDKESGQSVILGSRFRVYSVSKDLGGGGAHIPIGDTEKLDGTIDKFFK